MLDLGNKLPTFSVKQGQAEYQDGRDNLGDSVANGVYFYVFHAGNFIATRKMLLIQYKEVCFEKRIQNGIFILHSHNYDGESIVNG